MKRYTIAPARERLILERAVLDAEAEHRPKAEQLALRAPAEWVAIEPECSQPEVYVTPGPIVPHVLAPAEPYVPAAPVAPDVVVGG
jgi:hypothetical protein